MLELSRIAESYPHGFPRFCRLWRKRIWRNILIFGLSRRKDIGAAQVFCANGGAFTPTTRAGRPRHGHRLRQAVVAKQFAHLERSRPQYMVVEALPRRRQANVSNQSFPNINQGLMMEEPVAAAIVLIDPRRTDSTAHLAMLHAANNRESLERLLHAVQEQVGHEGIRRVILPVGLSPYLGTGVLQDQFHREPPLHAPYAPPYVPELFSTVCRPLGRSLLYTM